MQQRLGDGVTISTSSLLSLSEFERLSPGTLQCNSRTRMHVVGKFYGFWRKQDDGQESQRLLHRG